MNRPTKNTREFIKFTPEQRTKWEKQVALIEAEKPELEKLAGNLLAEQDALREAIATALQSAREKSGLTLAELQERTGIDPSQLSRLLRTGGTNPTVSTLSRLAEALGNKLVVQFSER